jgi:uncharacterized protein (DUF934 family)
MALIRDDRLVDDDARLLADDEAVPETGRVVVSLARWQKEREALLARKAPVGVRLKSDETPEAIADDLGRLDLVELEFPKFRDGRAYSNARILRERYGFRGELRAVGDVLMEQLHFMLRTGFNAFEIAGPDPLAQYETAKAEFSVWYQPTGDGRPTAISLRHHLAGNRPGR